MKKQSYLGAEKHKQDRLITTTTSNQRHLSIIKKFKTMKNTQRTNIITREQRQEAVNSILKRYNSEIQHYMQHLAGDTSTPLAVLAVLYNGANFLFPFSTFACIRVFFSLSFNFSSSSRKEFAFFLQHRRRRDQFT